MGQFFDLGSDAWGRVDLAPVHLDDRPTQGPPDAPVTMLEFADFECPYCAHAFSQIEALANTTYKGKRAHEYQHSFRGGVGPRHNLVIV